MSKSFFVVVPYAPAGDITGKKGIFGGLFGGKKTAAETTAADKARFEEHRTQLEQRAGVIQSGLVRTGVRVAALGTEELIELFFKMMNPGEVIRPALTK